jgi:hypothetical protein
MKIVRGKEEEEIRSFLEKEEKGREKGNDAKVFDFYVDTVNFIKGKKDNPHGNEIFRHIGSYKNSSIKIGFFHGGLGFAPFISIDLGFGIVYHQCVPNRSNLSSNGIISASIGIEENPNSIEGSAIPNKRLMKKGELSARLEEGFYLVTTPRDLIEKLYSTREEEDNFDLINSILKDKDNKYNKIEQGW